MTVHEAFHEEMQRTLQEAEEMEADSDAEPLSMGEIVVKAVTNLLGENEDAWAGACYAIAGMIVLQDNLAHVIPNLNYDFLVSKERAVQAFAIVMANITGNYVNHLEQMMPEEQLACSLIHFHHAMVHSFINPHRCQGCDGHDEGGDELILPGDDS